MAIQAVQTGRLLVTSAGMEAPAICFLHSYANPVHEDSAGELERAEFQHLRASRPAEVFGKALRTEVVTCIGADQVEVQGLDQVCANDRGVGWRGAREFRG